MHRLTRCALRGGLGVLGGFLLVIGAGGLAYANHFPPEMVSMTKHNLSANPNILFGTSTNGSSEVCVYCHTPHGASLAQPLNTGFPPLWNRRVNVSSSYQTYASAGSPNFDAASTGGAASLSSAGIKGVSLACLSCHDGTIAFDALVNLQGSGGYQASNIANSGPSSPADHALADSLFGAFGGPAVDPSTHAFKAGTRGNNTTGNPFGGALFNNVTLDASGANGTAPFPNLTTDLKDDHPISFQIPCDTPLSSTDETLCADPQFAEMVYGSQADSFYGGTSNLLYLKRANLAGPSINGALPQDKRDRIRAYPSGGATLVSGSDQGAFIECASCHNPHTPRTLFLRMPSNVDLNGNFVDTGAAAVGLAGGFNVAQAPNAGPQSLGPSATYWSHAPNQGSAICLSCHQK